MGSNGIHRSAHNCLGFTPRQVSETRAQEERLTEEHIHMIKESWKVIQEDIAKVGIIMFVRLFETHPECKDVFFLFRDVEDLERLRTSKELRAHGLRVMSFIEKSVARLDQLERLDMLAVELGKSHYRYNAPPKYYGYVGAEFICAVRPILKDKWTPELEKAWKFNRLWSWSLKEPFGTGILNTIRGSGFGVILILLSSFARHCSSTSPGSCSRDTWRKKVPDVTRCRCQPKSDQTRGIRHFRVL
ncbi:x globin isoform X1 [Hoplias malabaricus]|uniref:x globin isoform X1 n=1 Tax=Hoplias malabaricus TaxID=27720 RepID=UPI0034630B3B